MDSSIKDTVQDLAAASSQKSIDRARLTPKLMFQLAAAHTWPASIMPVFVSSALAYATSANTMPFMSILLMIICVLMQASVNTFNDYFDFIKGVDSKDDNVEASDSVLIYNNVNPKSVLAYAISLLVVAFLLGIIVIYQSGLIPLIIALIGAIAVVLYSAGKTPISYLPIGEVVSGFVMGGLISLASFYVLADRDLNFLVLFWTLPQIIGIALIMMTNNTCDIEKDASVDRRTLPVKLGRCRTQKLYRTLVVLMVLIICAVVVIWFGDGAFVLPFMILAAYPLLKLLFTNPLTQQSRVAAMGQICNLNIILGAFYAAALFL